MFRRGNWEILTVNPKELAYILFRRGHWGIPTVSPKERASITWNSYSRNPTKTKLWSEISNSLINPAGSYFRLNNSCGERKFWYHGQFSYLCYNLRTTHSKLKHCILCLPNHSFSTLFLYPFFRTNFCKTCVHHLLPWLVLTTKCHTTSNQSSNINLPKHLQYLVD